MKDITAQATLQKNKKYDVEPVNLLVIEFGGSIGTKYYSDRPVTIYDADGNISETYEAYVADWGSLDGIRDDISTSNDLRITLVNSDTTPLSDLFSLVPPEGKVVRFYQWYEDPDVMVESDKILWFNGRISSPVNYDLDKVELDIVDRTLNIDTKLGSVVNKTDYPKALDAHIGRVIPQVIGSVPNVPAVCTYTAGRSSLADTISDADTTITVDDGSVFPTDAAFVFVIEDEQVRVPLGGASGNIFLNCTRGYNGTEAVLHLKGTDVHEQLSQFRYTVHNGTAKSISNVRLLGKLLTPGTDYTIDQDNFPGQLLFSEYPSVEEEKETNLNDYLPDVIPAFEGTPIGGNIGALIDSDESNYVTLRSGLFAEAQRAASMDNAEVYKRAFLVVKYKTNEEWDDDVKLYGYFNGFNLGQLPKPIFTPEQLVELEQVRNFVPEDTQPVSFKATAFTSSNDAVPSSASSPKIETKTVVATTESVSLEPIFDTVDAPGDFFYGFKANETGGGSFDVTNRIISSDLFAEPDSNRIAKWEYVDLVSYNYEWDAPEGDGWYLKSAEVKWNDDLMPRKVRVEVARNGLILSGSSWSKYRSRIFANSLTLDENRIRVYPSRERNQGFDYQGTYDVNLRGYVANVRIEFIFEREVAVPPPPPPVYEPPPEPKPAPVVPKVFSELKEKTFEIGTDQNVERFVDLLNKSFGVRFETNSADLPDLEVYITEVSLRIETGAYSFEYNDTLTADVEGSYVDGTDISVDYGSLNELITRPDQVMKLALTHADWSNLFSIADINLVKYELAATYYRNYAYRLDFALVEPTTLKQLLLDIAFQVRSDQYWEEGLHVIKVLEPDQTTIKTLDTSNVVDVKILRSEVDEIINQFEIGYKYDYSSFIDYTPNRYLSIVKDQNLSSQDNFGIRRDIEEIFFFDKVREETVVQHVSTYYLGHYSKIKKFLRVTCFLDQIELQKHDIVGVTWPLDSLEDEPCRVIDMQVIPGNKNQLDRIELLLLREDYAYTTVDLSEGANVSDSLVVQPRKGQLLAESPTISDIVSFGLVKYLYDGVGVSHGELFRRDFSIKIQDSPAWGSRGWGDTPWGSNKSVLIADTIVINGTEQEVPGAYGLKLKDFVTVYFEDVLMLGSQPVSDRDSSQMLLAVTDTIEIVKY